MPSTAVLPHRKFVPLLLLLAALLWLPAAQAAAAPANPSGLPLPRFVTTRSDPVNVRVGPGTKYDVAWVYVKAGMPVEIIQEFDTWRKIRDVDGSEGWLHQNLLQGRRTGFVAPWRTEGEHIALLSDPRTDAGVRAWLGPKLRVEIKECDGNWCKVTAGGADRTIEGFLAQPELWGVYPGEMFD
jgi:SH3-like domain-containing protein